jgi:hypothetical protein
MKMKRVGATLDSLDKDVLGLVLQRINCARSLCALSIVNRRLHRLVSSNSAVWSRLMRTCMGLTAPQATMADFGRAAETRVWNWGDVFGDAVFWARLVYCQVGVRHLFVREFSDAPVSAQLRKLDAYEYAEEEEEQAGNFGMHTAVLELRGGVGALHIGMSHDCCLLLRLVGGGREATLMRVDGHPGGCGLSLHEAKVRK